MEGAGFGVKSKNPPLTRDISAGRASKGAWPPDRGIDEEAQAASPVSMELRLGATLGAVSGVRSIRQLCSTIVLIAEVDTRREVLATPGDEPA